MLEAEGLECPKCHKKGLVRCVHSEDDLFQCVYCDYQHDLTKSSTSSDSSGSGVFVLTLFMILLMLLSSLLI